MREAIPARGGGTAAQIALAAGLEIGPCLAALSELEDRDLVRRDQYGAWLISDRRQNRESRPDLPDSA